MSFGGTVTAPLIIFKELISYCLPETKKSIKYYHNVHRGTCTQQTVWWWFRAELRYSKGLIWLWLPVHSGTHWLSWNNPVLLCWLVPVPCVPSRFWKEHWHVITNLNWGTVALGKNLKKTKQGAWKTHWQCTFLARTRKTKLRYTVPRCSETSQYCYWYQ